MDDMNDNVRFDKMRKQLLIFLAFGYFTTAGYSYPAINGISTDQLLKAPVIFIGQINGPYTNAGQTILVDTIRGTGDITANIYEVGITADKIVRGEKQKEIKLVGLLSPTNTLKYAYIGVEHQFPIIQKKYVFFLDYGKEASEFSPVSPKEFAIEVEHIPNEATNSPIEILRTIAKTNVEGSNYVLAVRWAGFVSGLHDDFSYWTNKTQDARALIRATAYGTLTQNFPQTPGLRTELIKSLSDTHPPQEDSDVWIAHIQLLNSLSILFSHEEARVEEIQSLFNSGDKNVIKIALELTRQKSGKNLAANVVNVMTTNKDKDIQYDCIKTLAVLTGEPRLISQPTFLKQPDHYIQQWKKIGEDLATTPTK